MCLCVFELQTVLFACLSLFSLPVPKEDLPFCTAPSLFQPLPVMPLLGLFVLLLSFRSPDGVPVVKLPTALQEEEGQARPAQLEAFLEK